MSLAAVRSVFFERDQQIRHATLSPCAGMRKELDAPPVWSQSREAQSRRRRPMDLRELRERALEATTRFFVDRDGILPNQEGEEWEAEYRRQYDLAKRQAPEPHRAPPDKRAESGDSEWPSLAGAPAQKRWAAELRARRLAIMENKDIRDWLGATWTTAAAWVDTRDMTAPHFLRRV